MWHFKQGVCDVRCNASYNSNALPQTHRYSRVIRCYLQFISYTRNKTFCAYPSTQVLSNVGGSKRYWTICEQYFCRLRLPAALDAEPAAMADSMTLPNANVSTHNIPSNNLLDTCLLWKQRKVIRPTTIIYLYPIRLAQEQMHIPTSAKNV